MKQLVTVILGTTAIVMSWAVNHSFWWALFHFIVCGVYIPYWLVTYSPLCKILSDWIQ